jgi:5'-nucleotidase/UDP-sugar diphosphatase
MSTRWIRAVSALALAACAAAPNAPASPTGSMTRPAAVGAANACEGAVDSSFNLNVVPHVETVAGARPITLFFGTHTHGALVRPDGVTFAHYVALLAAARSQLPVPSANLFVGNGDDLIAKFCGTNTRSAHVVDAFNAAHLDADTYGFNEVASDVSGVAPAEVRELVARSRFTWVSANVLELDRSDVFAKAQGARRWVIREVGGVKVGLTGLIVPEAAPGFRPSSYGRDLLVIDPVEAMREVVPAMRAAGADLVVVLSHMDRTTMERVAREAIGIDAIVGSHEGFTARSAVVNGVILADGHDNMHGLGQLDLMVSGGRIVAHAFGIRTATRTLPEDRDVAEALGRYVATK